MSSSTPHMRKRCLKHVPPPRQGTRSAPRRYRAAITTRSSAFARSAWTRASKFAFQP